MRRLVSKGSRKPYKENRQEPPDFYKMSEQNPPPKDIPHDKSHSETVPVDKSQSTGKSIASLGKAQLESNRDYHDRNSNVNDIPTTLLTRDQLSIIESSSSSDCPVLDHLQKNELSALHRDGKPKQLHREVPTIDRTTLVESNPLDFRGSRSTPEQLRNTETSHDETCGVSVDPEQLELQQLRNERVKYLNRELDQIQNELSALNWVGNPKQLHHEVPTGGPTTFAESNPLDPRGSRSTSEQVRNTETSHDETSSMPVDPEQLKLQQLRIERVKYLHQNQILKQLLHERTISQHDGTPKAVGAASTYSESPLPDILNVGIRAGHNSLEYSSLSAAANRHGGIVVLNRPNTLGEMIAPPYLRPYIEIPMGSQCTLMPAALTLSDAYLPYF